MTTRRVIVDQPPREEYVDRLDARGETVREAERRDERIGQLRLGVFVIGVAGLWLLRDRLHPAILAGVPLTAYVALVVAHARTRSILRRARRAVAYYERALDRLEGRFAGVGPTGIGIVDEEHPYALHLDIIGIGSLYQLLCGARTTTGRRILADWLLAAADPAEILARQEAVAELRDRIDLREDLAVLDHEVVAALGARELSAWARAPSPLPDATVMRVAARSLAGLTLAAAVSTAWLGAPPLAWMLLADLAFWWPLRKRVQAVISAVEEPAPALAHVQRALARIEEERFAAPRAREIDRALGGHEPPASSVIRTFLRLFNALEARENMMFAPIAAGVLWGTNLAFAIERWRAAHGAEIEAWIRAVGELEALLDLSTLAYENPGYVFPTVSAGEPRFRAVGLGHPLLSGCTTNDVALGGAGTESGDPELLVVTGSNMSGKSTLLRTVGVNAVLAQAGAPVFAEALDMSPVAIGASIRTVDSLLEGASRFYAEIHAIRRAVDEAETAPPGLFLLDELLHGTNSEDRAIGAAAIVRTLLDRGALGIVTTHDLALATIADDLGDRARNAHFEFALDGDEIRFDYTLHPGAVKAGNALAIMRAAGLDV
ncbi:MAG: DNA mismatch repair protein MutS [Gemmatimonadota bacterium]|nr:DNA mismatch repair protein MutS [Gemmatimonadota bacterium]